MHTDDIIFRAEGYAALEMYTEAWKAIETLPVEAHERLSPSVVAVRLIACTGLRKWETGLELCLFAGSALTPGLREAMGRFYLAYAESLCASGDIEGARGYAQELGKVWPDGRELVLASEALRPIW